MAGRASAASATGDWGEAASWLERCLARCKDDAAVCVARLDLAVGSQDEPGFWSALPHLPAAAFDAAAVLKLRAWLFTVRHDTDGEERELRALVAADSGDQGPGTARRAHGGARQGQGIRGVASQKGRGRPRPRPVPQVPLRWRRSLQPAPICWASFAARWAAPSIARPG